MRLFSESYRTYCCKVGQAFTKTIFTPGEKARGHEIRFYTKTLEFMTTDQVIEMVRILGDSGDLYANEKRNAFGFEPLAELEGKRMQSLNYIDVNKAWIYQQKKLGGQNDEKK